MRILHLIDPAAPGGGPCTLRLLAETLSRVGGRHDVLVAGASGHLDAARRCGLNTLGRIRAPLNRPTLTRSALRRVLRHRERTGGRYDLIHGWTISAAASAVLATRRHPVLATAAAGSCAGGGDLRRLARRGVTLLAATPAVEATLLGAAYPRELVTVLPPSVDPASIARETRGPLRASWGADETTFVIAHLGEPGPAADATHALHAAGRVALTGKDVRIVVHPDATPVADRMMLLRAGLADLVILDDRVAEPWRVVAGLDAACMLHTRRRRDERCSPQVPGALLWAMAAGVPVIAEHRHAGDWLVDGSTGLATAAGDSNRTAARMLELFDHPALARRIGVAGRALAGERFAPEAFVDAIIAAWLRKGAQGRRGARATGRPGGGPPVVTTLRPRAPASLTPD